MQGTPGDIRQRIALEGGDTIKAQLLELGQVGEKAFQQIQSATAPTSRGLEGISSVMAGVRTSFATVATAVAPIGTQFLHTKESVVQFGESLTQVADRIFPHFKEVLAIGTAGSIVGLVEMIKKATEWSHAIGLTAEELGVSVEAYQKISKAAAVAGVDMDKANTIFTRLAKSISEGAQQQNDAIIDLAKKGFGDMAAGGVTVVRGMAKSTAEATTVVVADISKMVKAVEPLAQQIQDKMRESVKGIPNAVIPPLNQIIQRIVDLAKQNNALGEEMRKTLSLFSNNVPMTTFGEALERIREGGKNVAETFRSMGVAITDARGHALPLDQVLVNMAQNLDKIQHSSGMAAEMAKLLGRGWKEIIPILEEVRHQSQALGLTLGKEDVEMSARLQGSFAMLSITIKNLSALMVNAFGPSIKVIVDALSQSVTVNAEAWRHFAETLAQKVEPIARELASIIIGTTKAADAQTPEVKAMIAAWEGLVQVAKAVAGAFQAVLYVLDGVSTVINAVFGTKFTGGSLLAILAIGKVTGAFGVLTAAANLALDAFMLFVTKPLVALIEVAAKMGLIRGIVTGLTIAFESVVSFFSGGAIASLFAPLLAAIGPAGWIILALIAIGAALITWEGAWGDVFKFIGEGIDGLKATINGLLGLIGSAIDALLRLLGLKGQAGGPVASAPIPEPSSTGSAPAGRPVPAGGLALAGGGSVWGPGGIDTVPAWLTSGEWVMRTAAVAKYGSGLMHMINSLQFPVIPSLAPVAQMAPPSLRYAGGGPVPTLGHDDRVAVDLTHNGRKFPMLAKSKVANALIDHARELATTSAGPAPDWA